MGKEKKQKSALELFKEEHKNALQIVNQYITGEEKETPELKKTLSASETTDTIFAHNTGKSYSSKDILDLQLEEMLTLEKQLQKNQNKNPVLKRSIGTFSYAIGKAIYYLAKHLYNKIKPEEHKNEEGKTVISFNEENKAKLKEVKDFYEQAAKRGFKPALLMWGEICNNYQKELNITTEEINDVWGLMIKNGYGGEELANNLINKAKPKGSHVRALEEKREKREKNQEPQNTR